MNHLESRQHFLFTSAHTMTLRRCCRARESRMCRDGRRGRPSREETSIIYVNKGRRLRLYTSINPIDQLVHSTGPTDQGKGGTKRFNVNAPLP
jgi:hypothetical protein